MGVRDLAEDRGGGSRRAGGWWSVCGWIGKFLVGIIKVVTRRVGLAITYRRFLVDVCAVHDHVLGVATVQLSHPFERLPAEYLVSLRDWSVLTGSNDLSCQSARSKV